MYSLGFGNKVWAQIQNIEHTSRLHRWAHFANLAGEHLRLQVAGGAGAIWGVVRMDGWMDGVHFSAAACVCPLSSSHSFFPPHLSYFLSVSIQNPAADHWALPVGGERKKKACGSFWPWNINRGAKAVWKSSAYPPRSFFFSGLHMERSAV